MKKIVAKKDFNKRFKTVDEDIWENIILK